MTTTAYDLAQRPDLDRLEMAALALAVEADPDANRLALGSRIYEALVEALRHVEVSE